MRYFMPLLAALAAVPLAHAAAPSDWPSYNRTVNSDRFSPLDQITSANAGMMRVVCSFDTGESTAFQSGLVQVDGALFATTEHNTYSINPDTCRLNWKMHEDFKDGYLGSQRGVAIEGGRVFRGATDGNVYAYDQKTGARLWRTNIGDQARGETIPAAPIVWHGLVFIGNAGGDNRGVKGRMVALDAASGKIVWEYYLVPKTATDRERGAQGAGSPGAASWNNAPGIEITGGATWTSYSLDPATGELYVPGGNPAPDFARHLRQGENRYAGSVIVLDAATGAYKRHYSIVPEDFHDYDVSSAPALFTSKNGTELMALTPKDGFLYVYDRTTHARLYKLPMTTQFNTAARLSPKGTRFCPGTQGGSEWNGPAWDARNDAVISGQVDWCSTVKVDDDDKIRSVAATESWSGAGGGFGQNDAPGKWAGWLTSSDAVSGKKRWQFKAPAPIVGAVTATAGGVVFAGDMAGNFYVLDSASGKVVYRDDLRGAVGGGVITFNTGAGQKVAVSTGMQSKIWPTPKATAQIQVLAAQ